MASSVNRVRSLSRWNRLESPLHDIDRCFEVTSVHCLNDPGTKNKIVDRIRRNVGEFRGRLA